MDEGAIVFSICIAFALVSIIVQCQNAVFVIGVAAACRLGAGSLRRTVGKIFAVGKGCAAHIDVGIDIVLAIPDQNLISSIAIRIPNGSSICGIDYGASRIGDRKIGANAQRTCIDCRIGRETQNGFFAADGDGAITVGTDTVIGSGDLHRTVCNRDIPLFGINAF